MKYIKIIFFICAIYTLFLQKMSAQDNKLINVSAIVLDTKGNQIPGAIITSDNDQTSAIANESGEFSISASANSLLSVMAIGYKPCLVEVNTGLKTIVLKSIGSDMVQVAFNQVDKADLLGGVSSINLAKMLESNYTIYSLDNLSSYIPGFHNNIWGMNSKLVLVDGIPRDEYNVIPTEIEQITVLKSASAIALYGSRAAKGVVSITTKRGIAKGSQFNVRVNTGIRVPKHYAEYLGSSEYMTLYNEARANDGLTALYSDEEIANYASGKNPYRFPNVDFYSSQYLKKFSNRSEVTAEYTGGNDKARFYVNVGNYNTNSLLNFGSGKDEGENRFNVRGNLDLKLSDIITSKINTSVTFYDNVTANNTIVNSSGDTEAGTNFWSAAATLRPNQFSPLIPVSYLQRADETSMAYPGLSSFLIDGKYLLGGISTQTTNPFADIYSRGKVQGTTRKYQFDASLNFNLASLLKGLSFETQLGIDYNTSYNQIIGNNSYAVYTPNWSNDSITGLTKIGQDNAAYSRSLYNSYQRQTMFFSGAFKYNNTFNKVHNVSAILLAHAYTLSESQVYHSVTNGNLGLQASYNYKQKYYVDFTGNVVHSSRLAPGHREAFSPTVSLGWRISNEGFLSGSDIVNDLKLTASAGILNTDLDYNSNDGYYWYKGIYSNNSGAYFSWQEGRQLRSVDVIRGENYDLGFETRKEISFGLEASLFKNAIQIDASYFYNKLDGIPLQVANIYPGFLSVTNPSTTSFIPYVNYNADQRNGFDLGMSFNKRIKTVDLNIGMVATYYETKAFKRSENYQDSYQNRQGKPLDGLWGLKNDGFYSTESVAAINSTPENPKPTYGNVTAGDIKYIDVNKDGVIDGKDEVYLGRGGNYGSPLILGLNITAKWNNFSLFVLVNSGSGSYGIKNGSYYWATAGTTAKYSAAMRDRWSPTTAETATYPRLTTTSGDNNFRNSDFWLYKNDRINLAKVQVSYDIPKKLLAKTFMNDLGIYINGNDLLLIAKEKELMERNIGSAPQTRYYSIGVKAVF